MRTDYLKFSLWGGTQSGKTTYLASLYISALQAVGKRKWIISGEDALSANWLIEAANDLRNKGLFKDATAPGTKTELSFLLEGFETEQYPALKINLHTIDLSGIYFEDIENSEEILGYMAESNGFLLFLKGDTTKWEMISKNINMVRQRRQELALPSLNQKVAVCLAQYDDPQIFRQLHARGQIEIKLYKGRPTPMVKDKKRAVIESVYDGEMIVRTLESYFGPANIQFFALSSIGFYNQPDGRILIDDCTNVASTPEGRKIRSGLSLMPVNVWKPIAWLAGANTK